jgi:hypothetical protein
VDPNITQPFMHRGVCSYRPSTVRFSFSIGRCHGSSMCRSIQLELVDRQTLFNHRVHMLFGEGLLFCHSHHFGLSTLFKVSAIYLLAVCEALFWSGPALHACAASFLKVYNRYVMSSRRPFGEDGFVCCSFEWLQGVPFSCLSLRVRPFSPATISS